MPPEAKLDEAIAAEETRLAELDRLSDAARGRLAELHAARERAASRDAEDALTTDAGAAWSPERKVALFASLFRGREDVFPRRWEKPGKGRSGWAPRCSNEWVPGVCAKPRVRCGECPHQAFVAPVEAELLAHLQGRQVIGVYPLLADDTCRLLAIDLDGDSWCEDVAALREACSELGVLPAVERSRSGAGAHVWFYLSAPVPAALARRFGLMLLTDAMGRCSTLGMASYDRLFPSQDTLPKGGFVHTRGRRDLAARPQAQPRRPPPGRHARRGLLRGGTGRRRAPARGGHVRHRDLLAAIASFDPIRLQGTFERHTSQRTLGVLRILRGALVTILVTYTPQRSKDRVLCGGSVATPVTSTPRKMHAMTHTDSPIAPDRRVSRTESRVLEALRRRDRTTGRPRDWLDLRQDKTWLTEEVGTPHLRQLLDRMAGKGSLFQLGGGRYAVAPRGSVDVSQALPFSVALDVAMGGREYYLAFGSALADHGLIDENVDPIIAARASAVGGNDTLSVQGLKVTIVRVSSDRRWFGREWVKGEARSGYWRSDLERTLLDAVDRPDLCAGNELVARAWERAVHEKRLDTDRLVDYATRLGGVSALRAAFYSQQLDQRDLAQRILAVVPRTRSSKARLDLTGAFGPGGWPRDRATGLQINIPESRLRGWLSYGK